MKNKNLKTAHFKFLLAALICSFLITPFNVKAKERAIINQGNGFSTSEVSIDYTYDCENIDPSVTSILNYSAWVDVTINFSRPRTGTMSLTFTNGITPEFIIFNAQVTSRSGTGISLKMTDTSTIYIRFLFTFKQLNDNYGIGSSIQAMTSWRNNGANIWNIRGVNTNNLGYSSSLDDAVDALTSAASSLDMVDDILSSIFRNTNTINTNMVNGFQDVINAIQNQIVSVNINTDLDLNQVISKINTLSNHLDSYLYNYNSFLIGSSNNFYTKNKDTNITNNESHYFYTDDEYIGVNLNNFSNYGLYMIELPYQWIPGNQLINVINIYDHGMQELNIVDYYVINQRYKQLLYFEVQNKFNSSNGYIFELTSGKQTYFYNNQGKIYCFPYDTKQYNDLKIYLNSIKQLDLINNTYNTQNEILSKLNDILLAINNISLDIVNNNQIIINNNNSIINDYNTTNQTIKDFELILNNNFDSANNNLDLNNFNFDSNLINSSLWVSNKFGTLVQGNNYMKFVISLPLILLIFKRLVGDNNE